ncbi:MAG: DUF5054 domain-containing protein [Caulobacterales bacterium]|nr:DUF5054 domain-containing protein [Caulobacterales bacterium]
MSAPPTATIAAAQTVHLVFKTHLDIGFTRSAAAVTEDHLRRSIPAAIALARRLRDAGGDRFVWTTGSWLMTEALERSRGRARRELERALGEGDLAWHALPFTTHTELLDPGLVRYGLSLARDLDRRFGRTTIAAKMTDVPGHTVALVPLLAEAGVRLLHLGVNPASAMPEVPSSFRWRAPDGGEVVVVYGGDYGSADAVPGCDHVLAFAHTGDNQGPQDAAGVAAAFAAERARHPGARVAGSTLDAFARALEPVRDQLPVVAAEIGDSWIHGVGSDPRKVARFRALARWRARTLERRPQLAARPWFAAFSRSLLLVGEHTWGLDIKTHRPDPVSGMNRAVARGSFAAEAFAAQRRAGLFADWEDSWREQRAYLDQALAALPATVRSADAAALPAPPPDLPPAGASAPLRLTAGDWTLAVDGRSGAVTGCRWREREWADGAHPLFGFTYQTFGAADFRRFYTAYNPRPAATASWAVSDFGKLGLEEVLPGHGACWSPQLAGAACTGDALTLLLRFPDEPCRRFGCPAEAWLRLAAAEGRLLVRAGWRGKQASRVGEALWLGLRPRLADDATLRLEKLGLAIDPATTVAGGGRLLHAADAVICADAAGGLRLDLPDAPLVAPGPPALLEWPGALHPPARAGFHLNLWNNVWGTNFPQWSDEDAAFAWTLAATGPV